MTSPEKPSRFAYVLGTVLVVAVGLGWYLLQRKPAPTKSNETAGTGSVVISPNFDVPPAAPATAPAAPLSPNDPVVRERAIVARLNAALIGAGQPAVEAKTSDLLGVMMFTRMDPIPANPTPADIDAAVARRKDVNEGILAGSSAFLNASQLAVYRTVLQSEIEAIEALRAKASR